MATEQEATDLAVLKSKLAEARDGIVSWLESLERATPSELAHYGYKNKTNAEAMRAAFQSYLKRTSDLRKSHLAKYPDR